ncbi:MAG: HAMP domain-containing histidine kinase [Sphingomonadales bacterium]|nr:HAMP domain-containing histidine kinase [Sphingomonadales bacterium]
MNNTAFLSVPVEGLVSASGNLLKADSRLLQLQFNAAGDEHGPIAIPGLRAVAAIVARTGMRVERHVRVGDFDADIDLWVEAMPQADAVLIQITGWHERAPSEPLTVEPQSDGPNLVLNEHYHIVRMPHDLEGADQVIGKHFATVVELRDIAVGEVPMLDLLARRQSLEDLKISSISGSSQFSLSLCPLTSKDGHFLGYSGRLDTAPDNGPNENVVSDNSSLVFGRQFAPILRHPLSRIIANAETIHSRLRGPLRESYAGYAQDIANAARHLSELVSDLEDLEAIDRSDFSVAVDTVDLVDIARRVAGLLALKASDNLMEIHVEALSDPTLVNGEFRRILQIVLNLVTNAIRYAPGGSTVSIMTGLDGRNGWIEVADQGAGIEPTDQERIFEKFERLGRTGDGGSGLGLYISRRLARFMQGDLAIVSSVGQGTRFRLTLPAKTV